MISLRMLLSSSWNFSSHSNYTFQKAWDNHVKGFLPLIATVKCNILRYCDHPWRRGPKFCGEINAWHKLWVEVLHKGIQGTVELFVTNLMVTSQVYSRHPTRETKFHQNLNNSFLVERENFAEMPPTALHFSAKEDLQDVTIWYLSNF